MDQKVGTLSQYLGNIVSTKVDEVSPYCVLPVIEETLDGLLDRACGLLVSMIQVDFCQILLLNEAGTFQRAATVDRRRGDYTRPLGVPGFTARVYNRVLTQTVPRVIAQRGDSLSLDEGRTLWLHRAEALCLTPMINDGKPVGLILFGLASSELAHPFHDGVLRLVSLMAGQLAVMKNHLNHQTEQRMTHLDVVQALADALEAYDPPTSGHCRQMVLLTRRTAEGLGRSLAEIQSVQLAALLHDVGKIAIPDSILRKPGPLSDVEWAAMQGHAQIGADLVLALTGLVEVSAIIRTHHEHYNGSGYPLRLAGDRIPIGGRILAVADAFDAMTAGRVYRAGRSQWDALQDIQRCSGSQFDPRVVDAFIRQFSPGGCA